MAHYAKINKNNIVEEVIVIDNAIAVTEQDGINYIVNELKFNGTWLQTSYNNNIRGKFAGVGDIYDPKKNVFLVNQKYQNELDKKIELELEKIKSETEKKEQIANKLGITIEELNTILK